MTRLWHFYVNQTSLKSYRRDSLTLAGTTHSGIYCTLHTPYCIWTGHALYQASADCLSSDVALCWQQGEGAADSHRRSFRTGQTVRRCRRGHAAKVILTFPPCCLPYPTVTLLTYCPPLPTLSQPLTPLDIYNMLTSVSVHLFLFLSPPQSIWRWSHVLCASSQLTSPQLLSVASWIPSVVPAELTW